MSDFTASSAPVDRSGPTTVCLSGICCGTTFLKSGEFLCHRRPWLVTRQDGGSLSVPRGVCGAAGLSVGLALQPLGTAASFATLPYWRFLPVVVVAKEDWEASLTNAREWLCRRRCCGRCMSRGGHCLCLLNLYTCKTNVDKVY